MHRRLPKLLMTLVRKTWAHGPAFLTDRSGNIAILAALAMPVLVGFVGLGTEVGTWYLKQQTLQGAADSAALSAAETVAAGGSNVAAQADLVAATYGAVLGENGTTITVNRPPKSGTHTSSANAVEVIVQRNQPRLVTAIFISTPLTITARAIALSNGSGAGCVLGLDQTLSGTVSTQGSSAINLSGCSLYNNSASSTALSLSGSSSISALSVSTVGQISGAGAITTTNGVATGQSPISDPYANVAIPAFSGCSYNNYSVKTSATLSPGVYCGGLSVGSGAQVTLNPGIYYLDGGSFTVNGNASVTGTGVTIVLTSSSGTNWPTAVINGGATINLVAPTSGPTAGLVLFGDRNMPAGTVFKLLGGTNQYFGGAVYLPKAALSFAGGASTNTNCTQIIADTISFSGNAAVAVNCASFGTKSISASATLVE